MSTIKGFTSLEQSKVLAKILPIESADMYFEPSAGFCIEPSEIKVGDIKYAHPRSVPCWSLSSLLNVLPFPYLSKDKLGSGRIGWMVSAYPDNCRYDSCWHDNPIDTCYEMIVKLHEQKLL